MTKRIAWVIILVAYLLGLMVYVSVAHGAWWAGPAVVLGSIGLYALTFVAALLVAAVADAPRRGKRRRPRRRPGFLSMGPGVWGTRSGAARRGPRSGGPQ